MTPAILSSTTKVVLGACSLTMVATTGLAGEDDRLPHRLAAVYSGWFTSHDEGGDQVARVATRYLDVMAAAGFTAWYHKIQPRRNEQIDLSDPAQFDQVRRLAEACQERGLALVAYTYHYPHGGRNPERWPESEDYPPLVLQDGTVVEKSFGLANWATWRLITGAMFELAKASREIPIAAVGFDHEHLSLTASYDDAAWADFAPRHNLSADLLPADRGRVVADAGLTETYEEWYRRRWDGVIRRWVDEIHAINPSLSIAFMPYRGSALDMPMLTYAGTEAAPAIVDCWQLYNGSGITADVMKLEATVKACNPHNRYVQWFRPDSYRPSDIRIQAYHALWQFDGYCNWHAGQITDAENPAAYWRAYGEANYLARTDLRAGRTEPSIPFVPVTPMVAQMPPVREPVPQLMPAGDGTGDSRWIPMRDLSQVLMYARAGESLKGTLRHLAGSKRPLALQYRLVRPDGSWLYDNSVMPGDTESFAVEAPETGTYALYVTGGHGGQAWYAVRIETTWYSLTTRPAGPMDSLYMFHIRGMFPLTLWLQRTDPEAAASITIRGSGIKARVGNGAAKAGKNLVFDIPPGNKPIPVEFREPDAADISESWYAQDILIAVDGAVQPYLGCRAERRLSSPE